MGWGIVACLLYSKQATATTGYSHYETIIRAALQLARGDNNCVGRLVYNSNEIIFILTPAFNIATI